MPNILISVWNIYWITVTCLIIMVIRDTFAQNTSIMITFTTTYFYKLRGVRQLRGIICSRWTSEVRESNTLRKDLSHCEFTEMNTQSGHKDYCLHKETSLTWVNCVFEVQLICFTQEGRQRGRPAPRIKKNHHAETLFDVKIGSGLLWDTKRDTDKNYALFTHAPKSI